MKTIPFEGEKIFKSAKKIKYVFKPSKGKCNSLVVVFSGFNPIGAPPAYNYIRTLQHLDVNKLFILDDQGERGSYYLGKNRKFDVESSVVKLINFIAKKNNIPHSNIICAGSSKGGWASLYYGIKYEYGHVIVAAPQTFLGNYLDGVKEYPTLEFIAGDKSKESIEFLNKLLFDVVDHAKKVPDICIHVGTGDHHYNRHVLPFIDYLKERNFTCELDTKDFKDHGDVSFYQKLLINKLIEKIPNLNETLLIKTLDVEQSQNEFIVHVECNKKAEIAWYVFKDNNRTDIKWYSQDTNFEYKAVESGDYHFVVFAKDTDGNNTTKKSKSFNVQLDPSKV